MDGYQIAKKMREQDESRKLTLIALTGYGAQRDRQAAVQAGFDYHLVKPVKVDQLAALLQEINQKTLN
jgi:CheY-like chemotaxis protein